MPGQTALVANLVAQIIAEVSSLPRGVEDCYATAASYPKAGSWTIQTETGTDLFRVRP